MTTKKFDATPTAGEPINLEEISKESVQEAWKDYEAKPEYKAFGAVVDKVKYPSNPTVFRAVVLDSHS
ncbi:NF038105 family protein [Acinetobacter baumannii]|uniref:NF038105 family protein n=1 Tax=Acinetobacter baumannii TaxID=470 RepID=UPI001EEC7D85|nr:NF038105 family protein [Acinetobacter baumannii]